MTTFIRNTKMWAAATLTALSLGAAVLTSTSPATDPAIRRCGGQHPDHLNNAGSPRRSSHGRCPSSWPIERSGRRPGRQMSPLHVELVRVPGRGCHVPPRSSRTATARRSTYPAGQDGFIPFASGFAVSRETRYSVLCVLGGAGSTSGVPVTGSGVTETSRPNTCSTVSAVITSEGFPCVRIWPSRMAMIRSA